ncbi:MAG: hypothetical protein Q8P25_02245, partial [Candidatus Curtissbacteria bacterium]|nr:hypothetical protein [Candidatus Curtissbacteria bacterium]
SREKGVANFSNFNAVFGPATQKIEESGIQFVLLDNSDIYSGISQNDWNFLEEVTKVTKESEESKVKLTFVFAHKTPFHPDSAHIMGEDSPKVADQANRLIKLIEDMGVDGLFTGDLHFFAQFNSSSASVKITTIGAVGSERNFQGPRFGILTVFDDYSWEVEDIEIR